MTLDLNSFPPLDPPQRLLMGPGPSMVHPRVSAALAAPTLGHLDPEFLALMDELQVLLRALFRSENALTFAVSGTGSAGMEACLVNVLEPGDRVVIAQNGVFGGRMIEIAQRLGCDVVKVEVPFGEAIDPAQVRAAVAGKATKLVGVVHAETSTGVLQPIPEFAAIAHEVDALLLMDCVTSLGGVPVEVDAWGVDLAYSGTQKCLSCPPGLSPVTFSPRAVATLKARKSKVSSWYLDATLLLDYWGSRRAYHHTAPINMLYGLREAALLFFEEGAERVFARHLSCHRALAAGVEALGLAFAVPAAYRMPQLNALRIPGGAEDAAVRRALLREYGIEIGGGLGSLAGVVWRVGLMGHTARPRNVISFLAALACVLTQRGAKLDAGAALAAAQRSFEAEGAAARA